MLRALTLRIPYCLTFHGGGHSSRWRSRIRGAQLRALRPLLARATQLVALARFEIDLYSTLLRLPRERFALIPNGTDLAPSITAERAEAGDGTIVASIGRLERYKGHHRVIAALPRLLEQQPDAKLLIVGSGPYESALRELTGKLGLQGTVEFTSVPPGDRQGMAALLNRVALVVLMSDFETHPLVGLEAAAAGRRLLVADRAGLSELAEDGLARAIALGSGPRVLGDAMLEELAKPPPIGRPQLTTWDQCAEQLLALYEDIARGADRRR
jgi:glycosyltransferase involved in cell wall biosynthesis